MSNPTEAELWEQVKQGVRLLMFTGLSVAAKGTTPSAGELAGVAASACAALDQLRERYDSECVWTKVADALLRHPPVWRTGCEQPLVLGRGSLPAYCEGCGKRIREVQGE